jgi:hypothetical protein
MSRDSRSHARILATAALVVTALAACLTPTQRREDDFVREARIWNDDFRWARWDEVGQSMPPEEHALFQARKDLVDADLVMADYEITRISFLHGSCAATVDVTVQWYKKSDPTVRQASLQQRWDLRNGRWLMIKQRRVRGDRFPLVPEPVERNGHDESPAPAAPAPGPA